MSEVRAVVDRAPDPKIGVPRRTSGLPAPYYNLEQSVAVARAIYTEAGGSCDLAQLAALLKYSGVQNGGFRSRVAAAKTFGLIVQEGERLSVSERGRKIVAPVSDADKTQALVDAFLAPELFRRVYDEYKGQPLPPEVGLRNLVKDKYGVLPDRVAPAVKVLIESAEYAGLFRAGDRTRMVLPFGSAAGRPQETTRLDAPPPHEKDRAVHHTGGGGSGAGGGGGRTDQPDIHPAILGLLRELPAAGTSLTPKKRKALIDAFTATVGFIYPDEDGAM